MSDEYGDPIPGQVQPDGVVEQTTAADWQAIFDLICVSSWRSRYVPVHGVEAPLASAVEALDAADEGCPMLIVWLGTGVGIVFYLYAPETIDFDFDLDQITDQGALDSLFDAVRRIGQAVRKDVRLSHQSAGDEVFCDYSYEQDRFAFSTL